MFLNPCSHISNNDNYLLDSLTMFFNKDAHIKTPTPFRLHSMSYHRCYSGEMIYTLYINCLWFFGTSFHRWDKNSQLNRALMTQTVLRLFEPKGTGNHDSDELSLSFTRSKRKTKPKLAV